MVIDRTKVDPGAGGQISQRSRAEPLLGEEPLGRIKDGPLGLVEIFFFVKGPRV
jgi:hypothetical protein